MSDGHRPAGVRRLLRLRTSAAAVRREIDEEIQFHIESRTADLVARGYSETEARATAEREYGSVADSGRELAAVAHRRMGQERREEILTSIVQDLRYATRGILRRPALAVVTTFVLMVGIVASTVMFGVVDQLLLRPPPGVTMPEGVRRVYFRASLSGTNDATVGTTYLTIPTLRNAVPGFSDVAGRFPIHLTLGQREDASSVAVEMVSGNYFHLLGIRPPLGRGFTMEDDVPPTGAQVAVVSDEFWRTRLGGRADAIGQRLELNDRAFTIVGVAPRGLGSLDREPVDLWVPIASVASDVIGKKWYDSPGSWWVRVVARVRPSVSPELVTTQATTAYRREMSQVGRDTATSVVLGPLVGARTPDGLSAEAKISLWLMGVSTVVLLIACANVANLLIARTILRRREMAVRLALGVNRGRLLRQLLTEAALLAAIAGTISAGVAHLAAKVVERALLPGFVWSNDLLDARLLGFTLLATTACILLAGLAPAVEGIRTGVSDGLKASTRQVASSRGLFRTALVVAQSALSLVLLVGAGLFVKSLHNVSGRDVGVELDRVLQVTMDLRHAGLFSNHDQEKTRLIEDAARRARAIPGVRQAAVIAGSVPMMSASAFVSIDVPGGGKRPYVEGGGPYTSIVRADFFSATGAMIRDGRTFTHDEESSPSRVMIVNEKLAKAYWPGRSPVGDCVQLTRDKACTRVVGVVQNVLVFDMIKDDRAIIYLPPTHPLNDATPDAILVHVDGNASEMATVIQRELQATLPRGTFVSASSFSDLVAPQLRPWRLGATMFTLFGVVALVIAAVGLYSILAYWVSQRTPEIGVRLALGASRSDVVRLVALQALQPVLIGLVLGAALAAFASRWIAGMLYGTSPYDPQVYLVAVAVLGLAGVAASIFPARRSASVDPMSALRAE